MASLLRILCVLPLFFGLAEPLSPQLQSSIFQNPIFQNPFLQNPLIKNKATAKKPKVLKYVTAYKGAWELVKENQGVSGMHSQLLPNNKVIIFDATSLGPSVLKLNEKDPKNCRLEVRNNKFDCWAHSIEYDIATGNIRPLKLMTDAWCSSGGVDVNGVLVSTGGWYDGGRSVRYLDPWCENCDWNDQNKTLFTDQKWYSTQAMLPDGSFLVVGGRRAFSYEYVPKEGTTQSKSFYLPFLKETTDLQQEDNLYPFVHLSTDGNLFIFANDRSILLDDKTNKVIREFPILVDGPRSYPPSGMSVIFPIKLNGRKNPGVIPAEVIVCGGSAEGSFVAAERKRFLPATFSCGRIVITDPSSQWQMENMPTQRVMGDMLILPTGDLLILNGAQKGSSGWRCADEPNLVPLLYKPGMPVGQRFTDMTASNIPRMYHSSSLVLPDGRIMVTGSNTNDRYRFVNEKFPTELRMEKFSPDYLDPALAPIRPTINENLSVKKLAYGLQFKVQFTVKSAFGKKSRSDINLRMYRPPFTTHGMAMDQRQLQLHVKEVREITPGTYEVYVAAPASGVLAPPGYYLLFVLHRGVPSPAMWVNIK